ncbi:MAG: AAA family ATPase [Methylobacter sp.]|uniref:ExeA family protein n=1 Tax=Methylobacter sp. TaxID=2051955 RepID=UPI002587227E|nr:AAA family ATPase [Methylobacter sp.]MCL7422534.1 AAA family ATPase [Methylobacter sp.]
MLALKPALQRAGISQAHLARELNLSAALVAQLLNHEKWPTSPDKTTLKGRITEVLADHDIAVDAALFEPAPAVDAAAAKNLLTLEVHDMLLRKQTLSPQAKKHFGLFRDPFQDDLNDAEDVFSSPSIRYVREYLWTTAKLGGFMAVVGESGAGKSTLRKDLEDRINREDAPIILIQPYVLGMEDNDIKGKTLKSAAIADAIIRTVAPNEKPFSSMEAKSRQLHRILKDSRRAGFAHCLVIEEAHALSVPTLKHLKRFLELEDGFKKLLSIVLIGQTELKTKLNERSPEVREVVQRCELVELDPLDAHVDEYLRFKLRRVGSDLDAVFDKDAMDGIRARLIFAKASKTNRETISLMYPLMVNNLVTAALNQAAQLGFAKVSGDLIREA